MSGKGKGIVYSIGDFTFAGAISKGTSGVKTPVTLI